MQTEQKATEKEMIRKHPPSREYLIPILQEVQDHFRFLSSESIFAIADYLSSPSRGCTGSPPSTISSS